MQETSLVVQPKQRILPSTTRELVTVGFRHRRLLLLSFVGFFLGALLLGLMWPRYRAETKILVKRDRIDPVVTSEAINPMLVSNQITEEELNSEVELITSDDVLRPVVTKCGLDRGGFSLQSLFTHDPKQLRERRTAAAIQGLRKNLDVEPIAKTNVIRVRYRSQTPQEAANVLATLNSEYLSEHRAVHRPAGQYDFFSTATEQYGQKLEQAEQRMKDLALKDGIVAPGATRDLALQRLQEFKANLEQTKQQMAETQQKLVALDRLRTSTPARITTTARQADDALVLQQLKSTLMGLQLKRSELGAKFKSDYPTVKELDAEITQTQAAIAHEESHPMHDQTTDQNPAYEWVGSESVKAQAELQGLKARATELQRSIALYTTAVQQQDVNAVNRQDLQRQVQAAEESYLLYQKKREEARISDALDQTHIMNVAIAEQPTAPSLPAQSPWSMAALSALLALTMSTGLVFTMEYFDPSFRTPREVETLLNIPVLAAVPLEPTSVDGKPYGKPSNLGSGQFTAGSD
jgi:uncharacterized protein involved in exopolysaccharide biosynthesis